MGNLYLGLYDNPLTPDPNDCRGIVQDPIHKNTDQIIDQITGEGSILKRTECVAVIDKFFKTICSNLEQGEGYTSEYFQISPDIKGVFINERDTFDDTRHTRIINITSGPALKRAIRNMKVKVLPGSIPAPVLHELVDMKTGTINDTITPDSSVELSGLKLKLADTPEPEEGIFFINEATKVETRVSRIHTNNPKTLVFFVPAGLPSGTYFLEVRTKMNTKTMRTGRLRHPISVV